PLGWVRCGPRTGVTLADRMLLLALAREIVPAHDREHDPVRGRQRVRGRPRAPRFHARSPLERRPAPALFITIRLSSPRRTDAKCLNGWPDSIQSGNADFRPENRFPKAKNSAGSCAR